MSTIQFGVILLAIGLCAEENGIDAYVGWAGILVILFGVAEILL
jgi:hypothetical protein